MLAEVGLRDFHRFLKSAGLATLDRPSAHYGLPLVLGAGEVDLLSLTNLYAALAEDGLYRPIRMLAEDDAMPRRVLSIDASRFLTGILKELRRPDLPQSWRLTENIPGVAWKTGTSYGHRDAWSIGYSRRFTIGVWTGNPDGRGQLGTSGGRDAAPLLFELFGALEPGGHEPESGPGPRTRRVEVCALSHDRPGPYCPRTETIETIEGVSKLSTCRQHRRVFIDEQSGKRLAGRCLRTRAHRAEIFEVFPPELVGFWHASGRSVSELPTLHASCRDVPTGSAPRIVSPSAKTPYLLRAESPRAFQHVELLASVAPGTGRLFWYQDGELLGASAPTRPFFAALEKGKHELVVVDDTGRMGETTYWVE
jgi:penicillin-binding protein 1C